MTAKSFLDEKLLNICKYQYKKNLKRQILNRIHFEQSLHIRTAHWTMIKRNLYKPGFNATLQLKFLCLCSSRPLLGGIRMGEPCAKERFLYKATLTENPAMSSINFLPWSQLSYHPSTTCFPSLTTGLERPNLPTKPTGKTDTPCVYLRILGRYFHISVTWSERRVSDCMYCRRQQNISHHWHRLLTLHISI